MAYEVVMSYHLHMPSYFLGTFTEYPETGNVIKLRVIPCLKSNNAARNSWQHHPN